MSDRDILLHWLTAAAGRLSLGRRVRELGWFACTLAAFGLCLEILKMLSVPAVVLSALAPILVMAAMTLTALLAWRLARPTTLAQAAHAADAVAGLKDELKSAHSFVHGAADGALVERMLARAARTAQALDIRRTFRLDLPRSMMAAFAFVFCGGALAWFSPRLDVPLPSLSASGAQRGVLVATLDGRAPDKTVAELLAGYDGSRRDRSAERSEAEPMKESPAAASPQANDQPQEHAGLVAQLLQALQGKSPTEQNSAASPDASRLPAGLAQSLTIEHERRTTGEASTSPRAPVSNPAAEGAARVRQQLGQQQREDKRTLEGQSVQGNVTLNNRMRAVNRNSARMREVGFGEGQAAEGGGQTSVAGVSTGSRGNRSRSGGSEGEHPLNTAAEEGDMQPVVGQATMRLEAVLHKMRVEPSDDREQSHDFVYVPTNRQVSALDDQNIAAQWRAQREAALQSQATPLAYREGVKQYFLQQHAKED